MLNEAIMFATIKHNGQTRNDGKTPYIYHPMNVARLLAELGYDEKYQIAGILHDTLEDTSTTEDELDQFGTEIKDAVVALTRKDNDYVENLLTNDIAAIVKSCDIVDNMLGAAFCENRKWAKRYVDKSMKQYRRKFSKGVDDAIEFAYAMVRRIDVSTERRIPRVYKENMKLYQVIEEEIYEEEKQSYVPSTVVISENDKFVFDECLKCYYCIRDNETWLLSRTGWRPARNPYTRSEYGEHLTPISYQRVTEAIEEYKENGFFYDFVK